MPRDLQLYPIRQFYGGMNDTDSPYDLPSHHQLDAANVDLGEDGLPVKKGGTARYIATAVSGSPTILATGTLTTKAPVTSGFCMVTGKFYRNASDVWEDETGGLTINATAFWNYVTWKNVLLATNGVDAPLTWIGGNNVATALSISQFTVCNFFVVFHNYLFAIGTTESAVYYPNRIRWSNLNDPTTWTAADFIDWDTDDGDPITGAIGIGNYLHIHKEGSIAEMTFAGSGAPFGANTLRIIQRGIGTTSHRALSGIEDRYWFPNRDGIYELRLGERARKVSRKINAMWALIPGAQFGNMHARVYRLKSQYRLFFAYGSGLTTNNRVLCLHYRFADERQEPAYTYHTGVTASCSTIARVSNVDYLYTGDYAGLVFRNDSGTQDDSSNYRMTLEWPHLDFGDPEKQKEYEEVVIDVNYAGNYYADFTSTVDWTSAKGESVSFAAPDGVDLLGETFIIGSSKMWGADIVSGRKRLWGTGRRLSLKMVTQAANVEQKLYGINVLSQIKEGY